jgi:hypothetical protein
MKIANKIIWKSLKLIIKISKEIYYLYKINKIIRIILITQISKQKINNNQETIYK